jgi:hypothetical protein
VRPDVVVGLNDDVQARGLHPLDELPDGPHAWTGAAAVAHALLEAPVGPSRLRIEGMAASAGVGAIRLEARPSAGPGNPPSAPVVGWEVPSDGRPFDLVADVEREPGAAWFELATDRTWSPAEVSGSPDARRLGLALRRISLEPKH